MNKKVIILSILLGFSLLINAVLFFLYLNKNNNIEIKTNVASANTSQILANYKYDDNYYQGCLEAYESRKKFEKLCSDKIYIKFRENMEAYNVHKYMKFEDRSNDEKIKVVDEVNNFLASLNISKRVNEENVFSTIIEYQLENEDTIQYSCKIGSIDNISVLIAANPFDDSCK